MGKILYSIIQSFNHSIIQSFNHSIIQSFSNLVSGYSKVSLVVNGVI